MFKKQQAQRTKANMLVWQRSSETCRKVWSASFQRKARENVINAVRTSVDRAKNRVVVTSSHASE